MFDGPVAVHIFGFLIALSTQGSRVDYLWGHNLNDYIHSYFLACQQKPAIPACGQENFFFHPSFASLSLNTLGLLAAVSKFFPATFGGFLTQIRWSSQGILFALKLTQRIVDSLVHVSKFLSCLFFTQSFTRVNNKPYSKNQLLGYRTYQ